MGGVIAARRAEASLTFVMPSVSSIHRFLRFALATFLILYSLVILVKIFLFNTVDLNENMVLAEKM